jgi:hypothetical protein
MAEILTPFNHGPWERLEALPTSISLRPPGLDAVELAAVKNDDVIDLTEVHDDPELQRRLDAWARMSRP